ncbi:HEPN domain-containing protein [bacterium]|nr:HEPN domain-containing protein [bacterium]MBU1957433.1 HEPN domain-containing protein [bacterium]
MKNYQMAKEWVKASSYDLQVIREILDNENLTHMSAFHAQQALEKLLKAILEFHNQTIPKIHNIKKLLNLTRTYIDVDINIDLIIKIDTLYIESRYPGDMGLLPYGQPTIQDAQEFYQIANDFFDEINTLIIEPST